MFFFHKFKGKESSAIALETQKYQLVILSEVELISSLNNVIGKSRYFTKLLQICLSIRRFKSGISHLMTFLSFLSSSLFKTLSRWS